MFRISRIQLHEKFQEINDKSYATRKKHVLEFLQDQHSLPIHDRQFLKKIDRYFFIPYIKKWKQSSRTLERFVPGNSKWLNTVIELPMNISQDENISGSVTVTPKPKSFEEFSARSKRRKAQTLQNSNEIAALAAATSMALRKSRNEQAAKLITEIISNSPDRAAKIVKTWKQSKNSKCKPYTPEEALCMIVGNELSKSQYIALLEGAKSRNFNLYPSYNKVDKAKKACYPSNMETTERICEVPLQSLVDHTCDRLLKSVDLPEINSESTLCLYGKLGFDGSSGHAMYKQLWNDRNLDDQFPFVTCFVPLRLTEVLNERILWENPKPSSTRFCRSLRWSIKVSPLSIQWIKETDDVSRAEQNILENQISALSAFTKNNYIINFHFKLSMIDGKVANALSRASSMKCNICGIKISQMNDIEKIMKTAENEAALNFSLPILHTYIHFFDCLLHVSYRLPFKKWRAQTKDGTKELMKLQKKNIQDKFLSVMGLRVDYPKPGFGSSNDGNTARRFFQNSSISSEITGINVELINRFHTILIAISSGININYNTFKTYCTDTAKLFVELYPWFHMSPSVHKVLIHGVSVVKNCILPIGVYSEEVVEATNKIIKKFRRDYTRKFSRVKTNEDIFNRLMLQSDPFVSLSSIKTKKNKKKIPTAALALLSDTAIEKQTDCEGDSEHE